MKIRKIEYGREYEIEINGEIFVLNEDKNFITDERTGEIYLQNLPENPYLKSISLKRIEKNNGEIIIDKIKEKRENSGNMKISKKIEDYLTEEEKEEIQEIMNNAKKRMEEEKENLERMKNNPRYKELIKIRKDMENLRNLGIEIPEENFNRINEELEKMGV